jgi:hypothetical protein
MGKRYYLQFLIPVFITQVKKVVQFTQYNTFSKILPSTSMHFGTPVRTRSVARLCSETIPNNPIILPDTETSQNIDLSFWDIQYIIALIQHLFRVFV